jgi:adenosylcobyric acid synthase
MRAKTLMVQGTMSGVGKSLLVAGICRVLTQDGYRVAPFKSQNMALNSFITSEGLEMGRAQVVQAEAAGIEPHVSMNPILLKPTTDTGSQVIVRGRPVATMQAREYFAYKHSLKADIQQAFDELANEYDVVLIEGAGSPAEVNLKQDDIVNMGMAKMASAPVLLVGDIDRGGVFAQLIGTMMLLDSDERAMVRATLVNKFRGDVSILEPGLDILREKTGVPVAGVVPYMNVDIDDEDSLSSRLVARRRGGLVDVAVVRLPKVSNFTDFIALEATDGVDVRYVDSPREMGKPDLVVIPGTKSTISDLLWLRSSGLEATILKHAHAGVPIMGICGGYQMLGRTIEDPQCVEGGGSVRGMGLLPVRTVFGIEKRTVQTRGAFGDVGGVLEGLGGKRVTGYEIHMGMTEREGGSPLLCVEGRGNDGCQLGSVYGTYVHGLFDEAETGQALVSALLGAKGIDDACVHAVDMESYRQRQYDALAQGIRESVDMAFVRRVIEEGL